jgi:hypothetical protein
MMNGTLVGIKETIRTYRIIDGNTEGRNQQRTVGVNGKVPVI